MKIFYKLIGLPSFLLGFTIAIATANTIYQFDPDHTHARFEIGHFGTSTNHGGFYELEGKIIVDQDNQAKMEVTLPLTQLRTSVDEFTMHLKDRDFFEADHYPEVVFTAEPFTFDIENLKYIEGNLTIKGISHPITLTADNLNCYESFMFDGKMVCGGDFSAVVDRTLWGMTMLSGMGVPDEVLLKIQIEAVKQ